MNLTITQVPDPSRKLMLFTNSGVVAVFRTILQDPELPPVETDPVTAYYRWILGFI
jgi:hypothetical protein